MSSHLSASFFLVFRLYYICSISVQELSSDFSETRYDYTWFSARPYLPS